MTDQFINQVFKTSVAALSQKLGWDASQTSAIDILADVWKRQLLQIGKTCTRYAEHYGRSEVNSCDVVLAFKDLNLSIPELEEYVQNFDPVRLPFKTPKFPVSKQSHLNFLRPGSKEVLSRPVHIHEYLPPWEIPEESSEKSYSSDTNNVEKDNKKGSIPLPSAQPIAPPASEPSKKDLTPKVEDQDPIVTDGAAATAEDAAKDDEGAESQPYVSADGVFRSFASSTKRGSSAGENPALKRVRILMEEEGHPLREISSVMMTTSGFLSSSREGRLPDSRPPPNRDFFDPEPVIERKKKTVTMKKIVEGVKKIEKENQDEVELFGKPDKLVLPEIRHKSDVSKKSKEPSKVREDHTPPKIKHFEKESKFDKLKIFKKKSRDTEKHTKQHERENSEVKLEIKMEQDLETISSEEEVMVMEKSNIKAVGAKDVHVIHERKKKKPEDLRQSRKEKKRERERLVPGVIPIPRVSPQAVNEFNRIETVRDRESVKQRNRGAAPSFPAFSFGDITAKPIKSKRMRHFTDMKSLIPEISINISKPLPPLPELKPFFGTMSMAPGLIPTNLGPPPPLRFGGSSLSPSITITPAPSAIPVPSSSKDSTRKPATSLAIPSTVCASVVTITRIDMPSSQEQISQFDSSSAGASHHSSGRQSPIAVHHPDSTSGITITPILMTGDHSKKPERFEKSGGGGGLSLLEEDLSSKEQRRKEKEKRKELKKEKKKEKREKVREKERRKDEKIPLPPEKKERKESRDLEPMVPKLTLKIHSNASTPIDSPNRISERTETPPPPQPRKISIKPIADLVSPRTPSPELARFSPLVTRAPKVAKVPVPVPSPPVVSVPERVSSDKKTSGKSKSRKASSSQSSGLVTETVGFYIDEHGNKVWICPAVGCGREDDGTPMIGCDDCDDWYHFACVGITDTPEDNEHWYCPRCVRKGKRRR